jgi:hypothetical protein
MAVRTFKIEANSKGRMNVRTNVQIVTEPGTLTNEELETFRHRLADKLMLALADTPYLHVNISQMKVKR